MEERSKKNDQQPAKPKCWYCKQEGHYKRSCPHVACFFCGENHLKKHCLKYKMELQYRKWRKKKPEHSKKSTPQPTEEVTNNEMQSNTIVNTNSNSNEGSNNQNKKSNVKKNMKPKKKTPKEKRRRWIEHRQLIKEKGLPALKETIRKEHELIKQENTIRQKEIELETLQKRKTIKAIEEQISRTKQKRREYEKLQEKHKFLLKKENYQLILDIIKDQTLRKIIITAQTILYLIGEGYERINQGGRSSYNVKTCWKYYNEIKKLLDEISPEMSEDIKNRIERLQRSDQY